MELKELKMQITTAITPQRANELFELAIVEGDHLIDGWEKVAKTKKEAYLLASDGEAEFDAAVAIIAEVHGGKEIPTEIAGNLIIEVRDYYFDFDSHENHSEEDEGDDHNAFDHADI